MQVHIIADHQSKISELRTLFGLQHHVTASLLNDYRSAPFECDATITAVDLRNIETIATLKELPAALKRARRKIFVIERKARLFEAQAHALGATHVLFSPVYREQLFAALADPARQAVLSGQSGQSARETASNGAASFASMFSTIARGEQVDAAEVKQSASRISDTVAEFGFSHWLETVRRHHEGTYQHCLLVTGTVAAFGLHLKLNRLDMERLYSAAMFHDIGKAKIPLSILDKPARLDQRERALIETHAVIGYQALKGTPGISAEVLDAVRHHHEYLDGSGYPDGLSGESIADVVRILTIADIFSALIEDRRYKPAMSRTQAYQILCSLKGKIEAPLVAAFKEVACKI